MLFVLFVVNSWSVGQLDRDRREAMDDRREVMGDRRWAMGDRRWMMVVYITIRSWCVSWVIDIFKFLESKNPPLVQMTG